MPGLLKLLARLPLPLIHACGGLLGWFVYLVSSRYRRRLHANIERFEQQTGVRVPRCAAISAAGRSVLELPVIWFRSHALVASLIVETTGWELVEAAWARGKGIIFLTPHLGCFEITAQYYAAKAPITVLYRPSRKPWLEPIVGDGRRRATLDVAATDIAGVRKLMKALARHEAIGILPDQAPGVGEGVWVDFFGQAAYTMTLVPRLAEKSGADVILAYAERLPWGGGYHLHLSSLPEPFSSDPLMQARQLNGVLETLIKSCPGQYLWGYNRYKVPAGAEPPPFPR